MLLLQAADSTAVNSPELQVYGRQLNFIGYWYKHFQLPLLLPAADLSKLDSTDTIRAVVNVQHACQIAGCTDDGFDAVRQERKTTEQTRRTIRHRTEPTNKHLFLLNTHVIRNSALLQKFLPSIPKLDRKAIVLEGIREHQESKTVQKNVRESLAHNFPDEGLRALVTQLGGKVCANVKNRGTLLMIVETTMTAVLSALATSNV
ncbi:hypothetical protein BT69DRAFT_1337068 [Atractiella rhizophila]|nr:hypothetical protein BT69DRAFT_1337068 [Atractiella rhizophila]